jgi:hypothetical protein
MIVGGEIKRSQRYSSEKSRAIWKLAHLLPEDFNEYGKSFVV